MAENGRRLAGRPVTYHPLAGARPGEVERFLRALGPLAAVVVTDDFPGEPSRAVEALGRVLDVRLEAVDAATVFPFRISGREFLTAYLFRRQLQRHLAPWLDRRPAADPISVTRLPRPPALPPALLRRWPAVAARDLAAPARLLATLPIDHAVAPVGQGGSAAAEARLAAFLSGPIDRYLADRDEPDLDGTSGLSPWLHHGHLAAEEVVAAVLDREAWTPRQLAGRASGARAGLVGVVSLGRGLPRPARHLARARLRLGGLPRRLPGALVAAGVGPGDARPPRSRIRASRATRRRRLEQAATHDPLWNAAQRQLVGGRHHPQPAAHALGQEDPRVEPGRPRRRSTPCSRSTTDGRSTGAIQTRPVACSGASAATIAPGGRSGPSSGRSGT